MKLSKKQLLVLFITVIIIGFISLYKLPYYIYTPGKATDLEEIISIDNKKESEGSFHLLTVGGRPATPLLYGIAKLSSHHDIVPLKEARRSEEHTSELQSRDHLVSRPRLEKKK